MKTRILWRKLKNTVVAGLLVSTTGAEGLGMVCKAAVNVGLLGAGTWYCKKAIDSAGTAVTSTVPGGGGGPFGYVLSEIERSGQGLSNAIPGPTYQDGNVSYTPHWASPTGQAQYHYPTNEAVRFGGPEPGGR